MSRPPVIDEIHDHLLAQLGAVSRHVDILTPLLDPLLLDDEAIADSLTRLARRGRNARIRLIVGDIRPALESGHRLLLLARRLSTAITVRVLSHHSEWNHDTLILCDRQCGLSMDLSEHRWRTIEAAQEASREAERFDRLWLSAEPSADLRYL